MKDRAESLVAITEYYGVPDEVLIAWIHTRGKAKECGVQPNFAPGANSTQFDLRPDQIHNDG